MFNKCKIAFLFPTMFSMVFARAYSTDNNLKNVEQPAISIFNYNGIDDLYQFVIKNCPSKSTTFPPKRVDLDNALFLTPYIKNGRIKKGQELATVPSMMEKVESFAGYLTVNKTTDSNMFFWLFKSQEGDWTERPLVIWLQGGPGGSSLYGLFDEVGPFSVTKEQKLVKREYSWNRERNLLFFDNPVGTGFSFTKMDSGYARTEKDVARDLYEAIVQLYKLFPSLQRNQLFITGESYAGKYIPAIAYKIHEMNKDSPFKINLGGLMIGNGMTDPINQGGYASYLYELGLIDGNRRDELASIEEMIRKDIKAGESNVALGYRGLELAAVQCLTGLGNFYDFLNDKLELEGPAVQFLNDSKTKKALHVGRNEFQMLSLLVNKQLEDDIMQSVKPWVEELLAAEEFPIMYYSGQLDIIVPYSPSVEFYNSLQWPHAEEYHKANRCQFKVGSEVAGYYKTAGTFTEVMVRNTGHMVPTGQPKWAYELMDRFITNSSLFKCE